MGLKVAGRVFGGCTDIGTHGALFVVGEHSAASSALLSRDGEFTVHAGLFKSLNQDVTGCVFGDAANVSDFVVDAHILEAVGRNSRTVEGSSARGGLLALHLENFVVDSHRGLADEAGQAVLELVLIVEGVAVVVDCDVEEWVLDNDDLVVFVAGHSLLKIWSVSLIIFKHG